MEHLRDKSGPGNVARARNEHLEGHVIELRSTSQRLGSDTIKQLSVLSLARRFPVNPV